MSRRADDSPHAVVIGAGMGGLAAAIRLGARGYRVTVLERLDQPGGRAYVFRQDGFTFDAGPTVITAPWLFDELWELVGRRREEDVPFVPVDPFYRIRFHDGDVFDYAGDLERTLEQIRRLAPQDEAGYLRFCERSRAIYEVGFERLVDVPFGRVSDMVRILPDFFRLRSYRTVYGLVSRYVRDPKLRQVLTFHPLLIGGNPFSTTSIYTLITHLERTGGIHFAMGGTGALVAGMARLLESELGATLRLGADVDEVLLEGRRARGVRLATGEEIPADLVVSNADPAWLYTRMVPQRVRRRWTDAKVQRSRFSMSLFVWYFGTDRQYPDVAHHSILLGPRYKELLEDIFERKVLAPDFSLYLHRPTATDPSLAPEGCDAFYALSPVPHLDAEVDWEVQAEPYRKSIEDYLSATVLPGLGEHVVTSRVMTPLDFRHRLLSYKGAAFSFAPVFRQSAYFRPHNRSEEVENLYLVGAGTHPGAGLPGVLSSARVLDRLIPPAGR